MINSASRKVWHTPVRLYGLSLHLSTLAVTSSAPCPFLPSPTMPSTFSAAMGRLAFAPNLSFLPRQSLLQRYQHRAVPKRLIRLSRRQTQILASSTRAGTELLTATSRTLGQLVNRRTRQTQRQKLDPSATPVSMFLPPSLPLSCPRHPLTTAQNNRRQLWAAWVTRMPIPRAPYLDPPPRIYELLPRPRFISEE